MKKRFDLLHVLLAAVLAVGLVWGINLGFAAFSSLTSGPMYNSGLAGYVQEVRGFKMVYAVAGTAELGATTTIPGMEAGDVIIDVFNLGANASTISASNLANIDEGIFTAAAGGATYSTSTGAPTAADNLLILFVDVNNTE